MMPQKQTAAAETVEERAGQRVKRDADETIGAQHDAHRGEAQADNVGLAGEHRVEREITEEGETYRDAQREQYPS